jgi:NRPS condensation-like uncharacterized protein
VSQPLHHVVFNGSQVRFLFYLEVIVRSYLIVRENNPLEPQSGEPSKNELKKRAKAAEKEKKAAEKAAKLAEQQREKAAADEVRPLSPQSPSICP